MQVSQATKGTNTGGRRGREDKALTAPTSHEAGRARAVRTKEPAE